MDEKRQGEIALRIIKHQLSTKGIRLTPNLRREAGNEAKNIGISTEEAMRFMAIITRDLYKKTFNEEIK